MNAVECRLEATHQSAKFNFPNVKKFRNFSFEREGIRAYRAWDIGEGVFFSYKKNDKWSKYWWSHFSSAEKLVKFFVSFKHHSVSARRKQSWATQLNSFRETKISIAKFMRMNWHVLYNNMLLFS